MRCASANGGIYAHSVIGMNEAPPVLDGLGQRHMPMNVRSARIALEETRVEVQAERTKLGTIEGQLKTLLALVLSAASLPAPLGE